MTFANPVASTTRSLSDQRGAKRRGTQAWDAALAELTKDGLRAQELDEISVSRSLITHQISSPRGIAGRASGDGSLQQQRHTWIRLLVHFSQLLRAHQVALSLGDEARHLSHSQPLANHAVVAHLDGARDAGLGSALFGLTVHWLRGSDQVFLHHTQVNQLLVDGRQFGGNFCEALGFLRILGAASFDGLGLNAGTFVRQFLALVFQRLDLLCYVHFFSLLSGIKKPASGGLLWCSRNAGRWRGFLRRFALRSA